MHSTLPFDLDVKKLRQFLCPTCYDASARQFSYPADPAVRQDDEVELIDGIRFLCPLTSRQRYTETALWWPPNMLAVSRACLNHRQVLTKGLYRLSF
jgi:hypothetical protein